MTDPGFIHVCTPPSAGDKRTLLVLHGTGGNEMDLLPIARTLAPTAGVLSPRGKVLERGMPRFFRRLSEGVFDLEDLKLRTAELADFIARAADVYQFDARHVIAAGFSNGANMAASLLLLRPNALNAAVLFRAMVPIVPDPMPSLPSTPVLLSNGRHDPLVTTTEAERLANLLRSAGASVTVMWQAGGHELTPNDIAQAKEWLDSR
jgi:phospholipase/carboxylesterase/glyoxalase family protein